jgi:Fic family protein
MVFAPASPPSAKAAAVAAHPVAAEATAEAGSSLDRLYGLGRRTIKRAQDARDEAILRSARASAALEGAPVPLENTRRAEVSDPIVQAALRVGPAYAELAGDWCADPGRGLERVQTLVAATGEQVGPEALGRIRSGNAVGDPFGIGPPPSPDAVAARVQDLERLLSAPRTAHPVIIAAVAHGELLALRPYGWGDGIIARAAQRLTLAGNGADPEFLAVPEEGHLRLRAEYAAALRAYAHGTPDGVAAWVAHCATAIALGAERGQALIERRRPRAVVGSRNSRSA